MDFKLQIVHINLYNTGVDLIMDFKSQTVNLIFIQHKVSTK